MTQTLKHILTLFARGLESASVSDAVFGEALKCVSRLLPVAKPSPPGYSAASPPSASSPVKRPEKPPGVPLSMLDDVMDRVVARAVRPCQPPRTEDEERRVKDSVEKVFASAPAWGEKFAYHRKKAAAAAAVVAAVKATAAPVPKAVAKGAVGGGSKEEGVGRDNRPPRPSRSVSIRGPKRRAGDTGEAQGVSVAKKRSRG